MRDSIGWQAALCGLLTFLVVQLSTSLFVLGIFYLFGVKDREVWAGLTGTTAAGLALIFYTKNCSAENRFAILGDTDHFNFNSFFKGVIAWVLVYPGMILGDVIITRIIRIFYPEKLKPQLAVQNVMDSVGDPPLFLTMLFVVVVAVPIVEEILFRGILQSFLKNYVRKSIAISITAFFFMIFHLAPSQGVANIQIGVLLLLLAFFLGYLKEKYRSLLAPLGLHMTFNAVNCLLILLNFIS